MRTARTALATTAAAFTVALGVGSLGPAGAGAAVSQSPDTATTTQGAYTQCYPRRVCSLDPRGVWRCRIVYTCRAALG